MDIAVAVEDLGLPPDTIDTIADVDAVDRFGVQPKGGAVPTQIGPVGDQQTYAIRGSHDEYP